MTQPVADAGLPAFEQYAATVTAPLSEAEQIRAHEKESGHDIGPFRYCPECNWLPTNLASGVEPDEITQLDRVEQLLNQVLTEFAEVRAIAETVKAQVAPALEQMRGGMLGKMLGL